MDNIGNGQSGAPLVTVEAIARVNECGPSRATPRASVDAITKTFASRRWRSGEMTLPAKHMSTMKTKAVAAELDS
jgi:hypothetical protein